MNTTPQDDDLGGHAPEVALQVSWQFRLGRKDSLLVLKALGGRLVTPEEVAAAKELGDRLTLMRAHEGWQLADGLAVAATNTYPEWTGPKSKVLRRGDRG